MKSMLIQWTLIFLAVGLISCSEETKEAESVKEIHVNVDDQVGIKIDPVLTDHKAHSGKFSTKMDYEHPWGLKYETSFEDITDQKFSKIVFSAWFYVDSSAKTTAIVIEHRDKNHELLHYYSFELEDYVDAPKKWVEVEVEAPFKTYKPDDILKVYAYHKGEPPHMGVTYMDDVTYRFMQ
jgi:hypothetical protein